MPFEPKDWKDYPDTSTRITAAALEDLETRVTDYTDDEVATKADASHAHAQSDVTGLSDALAAKQSTSEKAQALGYASLDGGGKVPATQLPNSVMEFQGMWNASTNTPTLADGTANPGDVYRVSNAGSVDLGSGSINFKVNDQAVYGADGKWYRSRATDDVTSVAGKTGDVSLASGDVSGLGTAATKDSGAAGSAGKVLNADDASTANARTPTAHKSSHATGGSDALAPSDIGASASDHTHAGLGNAAPPPDIQTFTTAGNHTWTKPSDLSGYASYTIARVICIGGGGGGGSGRKGAAGAQRSGGGGGGCGGLSFSDLPIAALGATELVMVGNGGAGGAAQTTNTSNGNNGNNGDQSQLGASPLVRGAGGVGGTGGATTAGAGGLSGLGSTPLAPQTAGAGSNNAGAAAPYGSAAGGGGGGITNADAPGAGGAGGQIGTDPTSPSGGAATGASGGSSSANSANAPHLGAGGGGGGAGTGAGGAGGAGGKFGGGGGGGAAGINSVGDSGKGGDGHAGCVVVVVR